MIYFACCCIQTPDRKQLEERSVCFGSRSKGCWPSWLRRRGSRRLRKLTTSQPARKQGGKCWCSAQVPLSKNYMHLFCVCMWTSEDSLGELVLAFIMGLAFGSQHPLGATAVCNSGSRGHNALFWPNTHIINIYYNIYSYKCYIYI